MEQQTKIVTAVHRVVRMQGGDLMPYVRQIASEKRTGALTILFSQGGISALEWRDRGTYTESFGEPWTETMAEVRR